MGKTQTRRTISLERELHRIAEQRAKLLGRSLSFYVSELLRADLTAAGVSVPAAPIHFRNAGERRDGTLCRELASKDLRKQPGPPPKPRLEPLACWWCRKGFAAHETAVVVDTKTLHARCIREARL